MEITTLSPFKKLYQTRQHNLVFRPFYCKFNPPVDVLISDEKFRVMFNIFNITTHRRTGRGGEGGCSPPKFWATQFFGQQEEIWAKPVFKDVSMVI